MSMNTGILVPVAPPAQFETLSVGSKVQMADLRQEIASFEGLVVEVDLEWGTHNLPVVKVLQEGADTPTLCIQDGRWQVTVVSDAAAVRKLMGVALPKTAVTVLPIVDEHVAVKYVGGKEQSAELVRWSIGRGIVSYEPGDGINTFDQLHLRDGGQLIPISVGDWLLESPKGFQVVRGEDFTDRFEEKRK